jgi:hypothetical protein
VTKIYYLVFNSLNFVIAIQVFINASLTRALEGTLSRWFRLYLQSLAPTPVARRVDARRLPDVVKIIAESLSQHDVKHVVPISLSGIRVGGRETLCRRH